MRLGTLAFAAALLFAATPLVAQGASPVPLAGGEVLAQVGGLGQVRSRPEVARFRLTLSARGDSPAAARVACDAALRDLVARLRDLGVPDAATRLLPPGAAPIAFVGNAAYGDDDMSGPAGVVALQAMARQRKVATSDVQIELTDMTRLSAVRRLLLERDDVAAQPPALSLRDDTAARRAAIAQAIAKAREEAEAYSAALGLRVARITRVFDPAATTEQAMLWAGQMIAMTSGSTGDEVVTDARVGMDVVLAPR